MESRAQSLTYLDKAKSALRQGRNENALSFAAQSLQLDPALETNFEAAVVRYTALKNLQAELKRDEALDQLLAFSAKLPENSVMRLMLAACVFTTTQDADTAKRFYAKPVEFGFPEFDSVSRCYFALIGSGTKKKKLLELSAAIDQVPAFHPLLDDVLHRYCELEDKTVSRGDKVQRLKALRKRLKDDGKLVNRYVAELNSSK